MDPVAHLLEGSRARGALVHRTVLEPPWSLRIADGAPVAVATTVRGDAWLVLDDAEPVHLPERSVAIIHCTVPYTVADDPATAPQWIVHEGNRITDVDGADVTARIAIDSRTCSVDPDGRSLLVAGSYQVTGDVNKRLLAVLPPVVVVPYDDGSPHQHALRPVLDLLLHEVVRDEPGQDVVLDRLLDLVLVSTLRVWFARPEARPPRWYDAQGDEVVGPALRLMHDEPARGWTVASLAAAAGVSRAAFARRFTALVGEPPMSYLTAWRLSLAADLLREPGATVAAVARRVGYANAFALSVAFKRDRGVSPSEHRAAG